MQFTDRTATQFRNDFESAMQNLANQYNVTIDMGRITIYEDKLSFKVNALDNVSGTGDSDANKFALYSRNHGLTSDAYGKVVTDEKGVRWTIVGAKERVQKYPIIMKNGRGTKYKFASSYVKGLIKNSGLNDILVAL